MRYGVTLEWFFVACNNMRVKPSSYTRGMRVFVIILKAVGNFLFVHYVPDVADDLL